MVGATTPATRVMAHPQSAPPGHLRWQAKRHLCSVTAEVLRSSNVIRLWPSRSVRGRARLQPWKNWRGMRLSCRCAGPTWQHSLDRARTFHVAGRRTTAIWCVGVLNNGLIEISGPWLSVCNRSKTRLTALHELSRRGVECIRFEVPDGGPTASGKPNLVPITEALSSTSPSVSPAFSEWRLVPSMSWRPRNRHPLRLRS